MSYVLDGTTLPRPKSFVRSFVSVSQEYSAVNGKGTKDTRLITKEKYELSWDDLTPSELSGILTIVEKNTAVSFYVDEENLVISAVNVLVIIGGIEYSTIGDSYYSGTTIELVEVS